MTLFGVGMAFMADAAEQREIGPIKLILEMRPIGLVAKPVRHRTARIGDAIIHRDDGETDQFNPAVHQARLADLARFGKSAKARDPFRLSGAHAMMFAIGLLLTCQLAGESLTRLFGWPLPGPVLGLIFLFVLLLVRDRVQSDAKPIATTPLHDVCAFLLANLSLMFVPAGVGIVQEWSTLQRDGAALIIALVVSTALALGVTAIVFQILAARFSPEREG